MLVSSVRDTEPVPFIFRFYAMDIDRGSMDSSCFKPCKAGDGFSLYGTRHLSFLSMSFRKSKIWFSTRAYASSASARLTMRIVSL